MFISFAFFGVHSSQAQVRNEYQSWWTIGCEKKLSERWTGAFKLEARFDLDAGMFVNDFANLSFKRKWSNALSTEFHYRYSVRNRGGGLFINSHRFMADVNYRIPIQKTDLVFRLRYGREDESMKSEGFFSFDENVVRQKIGLKRKIWKVDWTISAEQFETFSQRGIEFDQFRLVLNADYRINKRNEVDVFLMLQDQISTVRYNFGAGYTYRFKSKK